MVSIHPAGELGNSNTMLQGARMGTIDIVLVGNPYFSSFAPEMNLLDLPFLFKSYEHAYSVMDGEVGNAMLDGLHRHKLQGLAFWEIGFRNLTNSKRPIRVPADLKGLKIRTTPNPAHIKAFTLWGANPTPMPFKEVYSALQTGTIDGQENPVNHIYASRLHEVQKYLSLTGHAYTAAPLVMNLNKYNSLTPKQQKTIRSAALKAAAYERDLNAQDQSGSLEAMKKAGTQVVMDPDANAFRNVVKDAVREMYVGKHGDALIKKVEAAGQ
jgi:tripartite ATP-independent transporter DctP family solute receptor